MYIYIYFIFNVLIMVLRFNEISDFFLVDWFWVGILRIFGCWLIVLFGFVLGWMIGFGRVGVGWFRDFVLRLSFCNICCSRLISASFFFVVCCINFNFFLRRREFRIKVWLLVGFVRVSDMKGYFGKLELFS